MNKTFGIDAEKEIGELLAKEVDKSIIHNILLQSIQHLFTFDDNLSYYFYNSNKNFTLTVRNDIFLFYKNELILRDKTASLLNIKQIIRQYQLNKITNEKI